MTTIKKVKSVLLGLALLTLVTITTLDAQTVEQLGRATVYLRHQSQAYEYMGGEKMEVWYKKIGQKDSYEPKLTTQFGTGFIIRHKSKDYLVTAKHVAEFLSKNGEIVMNLPDGNAKSWTFGFMETAKPSQNTRWFFHPFADIAIHPIVYPVSKVDQDSFPSEAISKNNEAIPLLSTAYILGFPLGLGVHTRLSPVAKKSQVASGITSLEAINIRRDLKFILLDEAAAQGYSGSPVFYIQDIMASGISIAGKPVVKAGERVHLIGICSQQIFDAKGGKISAIVPISYLWEILDSPEFKQYEDN